MPAASTRIRTLGHTVAPSLSDAKRQRFARNLADAAP